MEQPSAVHEFWAVTQTSLYSISSDRDEKGTPLIYKIGRSDQSDIEVGQQLGTKEGKGSHVGITNFKGILIYTPLGGRCAEENCSLFYGAHTSQIVGLFLRLADAMDCFSSSNKVPCDPRWKKETMETLTAIGEDHPVFVPSKGRTWGLNYG
jgi:hypothetical protein